MDLYRSTLIFGGNGMLARTFGDLLQRRRVGFVAVDRAECDITQPQQVQALFREYKPSLVLNCAAYTAVDACEDQPELANAVNGHAVEMIAQFCREYGSKLVHYSTDFVFDGQNGKPYRPDDGPNPLSAYGRSKLMGEQGIEQVAPPSWLTIRTAWLFGRYGNCFPKIIVERARTGQTLRVVNDQSGSPTYADDLAEATLNLLERNASGLHHITNSSSTTWYEFSKAILEEFDLQVELLPISTQEWRRIRPKQAIRPPYSVLNCDAYHRLTGQQMRPWREALRDYGTAVA